MTALMMDWPYDVSTVESPAFLVDRGALERNLDILRDVQERSGAKILLALKGFAMWSLADQIMGALPGVTSSSVGEARLGAEEFRGEVHACSPAYSDDEFRELITLCDHIVFNSVTQKDRLLPIYRAEGKRPISFGLRVNHGHREVETELYDPSAPCSRMGAPREAIPAGGMEGVEGLHFHSLCELGSDALERSVEAFEAKFGDLIPGLKWLNFGGGHHITAPGYDIERLVRLIKRIKSTYGVTVYLEPGEAIAIRTGVLVSTVLDLMHNQMDLAILNISATAHMPDVLEMPYRPDVLLDGQLAGKAGEKPHTYRLGCNSCLSGDVIGDFSFHRPLKADDRLVFLDMSHYTMVKTTTFNGVRLPSIGHVDPQTGEATIVRRFGYEDYKNRLS